MATIKRISSVNKHQYFSYAAMIDYMRLQEKLAEIEGNFVAYFLDVLPTSWKVMFISLVGMGGSLS